MFILQEGVLCNFTLWMSLCTILQTEWHKIKELYCITIASLILEPPFWLSEHPTLQTLVITISHSLDPGCHNIPLSGPWLVVTISHSLYPGCLNIPLSPDPDCHNILTLQALVVTISHSPDPDCHNIPLFRPWLSQYPHTPDPGCHNIHTLQALVVTISPHSRPWLSQYSILQALVVTISNSPHPGCHNIPFSTPWLSQYPILHTLIVTISHPPGPGCHNILTLQALTMDGHTLLISLILQSIPSFGQHPCFSH